MSEAMNGKELFEALSYKKKNIYEEADSAKIKAIFDYSEGYKNYLDNCKTEREATEYSIELIKKAGKQYAGSGVIGDELMKEITSPMIPEEQYAQIVNGSI